MATNAVAQNAIKNKLVHKLEVSTGQGRQSGTRDGMRTAPSQESESQCFLER